MSSNITGDEQQCSQHRILLSNLSSWCSKVHNTRQVSVPHTSWKIFCHHRQQRQWYRPPPKHSAKCQRRPGRGQQREIATAGLGGHHCYLPRIRTCNHHFCDELRMVPYRSVVMYGIGWVSHRLLSRDEGSVITQWAGWKVTITQWGEGVSLHNFQWRGQGKIIVLSDWGREESQFTLSGELMVHGTGMWQWW